MRDDAVREDLVHGRMADGPRGAAAAIPAAILAAALALLLAGCGTTGHGATTAPTATTSAAVTASGDPFAAAPPYTWPANAASLAAATLTGADLQVIRRIAATPTAIWLTPEAQPAGRVGPFVRSIVSAAGAAHTPVFVVYGITDRDCATGQSSGGLAPGAYLAWVKEIAMAAGPSSAVILEPDALASAPQCGDVSSREALLARAVGELAGGSTVYLDAGHANWIPAPTMAAMLEAAGIDQVRGFSLNVSSFGSDAAEAAYAASLRDILGGQASYVIDTGRNGRGSDTDGAWCNPPGQALGHVPAAVDDGSGLDAYLWIKPPGESDGSCNGGPPAGVFWVEGAVSLAHAAGW